MRFRNSRYLLMVLFCSFCTVPLANAQDYNVASISEDLKKDAVSVVRDHSAVFTQLDVNNAVYKVHRVVTVLNEKGDGHAAFSSYKDGFVDFKKFEGVIRNALGKEIKKIKKGDLTESSLSAQMATDSRGIMYEVSSPVYPYTVEYTYEQQLKNGIIGYPNFMPTTQSDQSVEKAEYRMELPLGVDLRYLSNFDCTIKEENTTQNHLYSFSCANIKAMKYEPLANFGKLLPRVRLAPKEFCFDKVCGDLSTWQNLGLWQKKLLDGRDVLPAATVEEVKNLTKDASSDREKVEILYKFLQNNTRYVSIQLGIGGLQPISAESTIRNNYGDCKGLSNLMMAMLKVVDIPSNYTVINMGDNKDLFHDFPDMLQTNHVILLVPLKNDSIWLECTSSYLPAGYVHDDIAGHDALVITDQGGVLCKLPAYSSKENLKESTLTINISENGTIEGKMAFVEHVHGFGSYHVMMKSNDREHQVRYITGNVNFPKLEIGTINTSEQISELPFCTLEADFKANNYITKTGQRLFIPLSPLKKDFYRVFRSRERVYDILLNDGFSEKDMITINLPEGYVIESMPPKVSLDTPYGTLDAEVEKISDTQLSWKSSVNIFGGRYNKDQYNEIKSFFEKVAGIGSAKLVVKKAE